MRRYSGTPYIVHPERVAKRTSQYTNNEIVIIAAWLHDVVEDCGVSIETLTGKFNKNVATLVTELTNPSKQFPQFNRKKRKTIDRGHIAEASAEAQLIKVIDRIDNLNELSDNEIDFQILYATESLELAKVLKKAPQVLVDELKTICYSVLNEHSELAGEVH